jgi:hypothetical protein
MVAATYKYTKQRANNTVSYVYNNGCFHAGSVVRCQIGRSGMHKSRIALTERTACTRISMLGRIEDMTMMGQERT